MPYIAQEDRPKVDAEINALAQKIKAVIAEKGHVAAWAGVFNYCVTQLALQVLPERRYWACSLMNGVLGDIKTEFERRFVGPYEDEQIAKNGDIQGYQDPYPIVSTDYM
jgi:hypothetical protein